MARPRLSLEYFYVVKSSLVASIVDDEREGRGDPEVECEAHLMEPGSIFQVVRLSWGVERETAYAINVEMHGCFKLDLSGFPEPLSDQEMRDIYLEVAINAAQILYGSVRGHVASITAVAPYGVWFLPTESIGADDVKFFADDEGIFSGKGTKSGAKKSTKKKRASPKA